MIDSNSLGRWGKEHPKSLWQTLALPNFVEGEVIDVNKTLETLLAFGKLGVTGTYIKPLKGDALYVHLNKLTDYLMVVRERINYGSLKDKKGYAKIYVYNHTFPDGRRWSIQIEGEEPTWDLTSYKVSPDLNIQMMKD